MQNKDKNYLALVIIHILLGVLVFYVPIASQIYGYSMLLIGVILVIKSQNKKNEVLSICAYIVGSEVFLRMTYGNPSHEFAKYCVVFFLFVGVIYSGFSKSAIPYWIFLIILIPGIIIANENIDYSVDFRKKIAFNLSGPICLGIATIYTFGKRVTIGEVGNILLFLGLPIISTAAFVNLFAPKIKDVLSGTGSNEMLSGGFGPNQVATIFGLGMFIFFTRAILYSRTKIIFFTNLVLAFYISYRGFLTFSRGGMMTGFGMIGIFIFFMYYNSMYKGKVKLNYLIIILTIVMSITWIYTSIQTDGLINKRYAGKNAQGIEKQDKFSGRGELAEDEITMFLENPFFGVGVGKGTEIRSEKNGFLTASHDEITRMLAEHGALGILALMILFFTPIFYFLGNRQNIYLFCFVTFWFLTINHAAMRTASPSFVYALSMLKVRFDDDDEVTLHRKQTV
jgi:hypothetical protein